MVSRVGTYLSDDSVRRLCPESLPVPMGQVYKMVKTQNVNAQRLSRRPESAGVMLRTMSRKFGLPLDELREQYVTSLYAIKNQGVIANGVFPLDTERRRQGRAFRQPVGVGGRSTGSIDREVLAESLAQADVDITNQERRAMAAEYRQMLAQAQSRLSNMTKVERTEEYRRVSAGDYQSMSIAGFRRLSEGHLSGRDPQIDHLIQYELRRGWNPVRGNPLQTGQMMPPEAGTLGTATIEEIEYAQEVEPVQQEPIEVGETSAAGESAGTRLAFSSGFGSSSASRAPTHHMFIARPRSPSQRRPRVRPPKSVSGESSVSAPPVLQRTAEDEGDIV